MNTKKSTTGFLFLYQYTYDQIANSHVKHRLNEEMIETLFTANGSNIVHKDNMRHSIMPLLNPENRVLHPKKSQNIAILLRALNVTVEEVCEALSEGKITFIVYI